MRIQDIQAIGLTGATPEGGWSNELRPEDSVHTLVVVRSDEGHTGVGSVFTNAGLVRAALAILEPLYLGENPLERERLWHKVRKADRWFGLMPFNVHGPIDGAAIAARLPLSAIAAAPDSLDD